MLFRPRYIELREALAPETVRYSSMMRVLFRVALATLSCCGARSGLDVLGTDASAPFDAGHDHVVSAPDVDQPDVPDVTQPPPPVQCPPAPTPVLLASGIKPTYDVQLGVDDYAVYMADGEHITRFPKCAPGAPLTLTGYEPNSGRVFVDGTTVYFLDIVLGGSVRTVPTLGGTVTTIATAPAGVQPMDLHKLGETLFYLLGPSATVGVFSVPTGGGTPLSLGPAIGDSIAVDAASVYFFSNHGKGWAVESRPQGGGASTYLADSLYDGALAVDDANVYFSGWGGPGFVRAVPKLGGATTTISDTEGLPVYLALDGGYLYWVNGQQSVKRVLTAGGTPKVVVTGNIGGIGFDATSLYYSLYDGSLYRVDK